MMEIVELEGLGGQAKQVLGRLIEMALLKPGQILMVGCSSGEIDNFKIGSHLSVEIGMTVYTVLYQGLKSKGIYLTAQRCEHLNRVLILGAEATQVYGYESVNVVPQLKTGGSFVVAVYATLKHPVAVEHIKAHAGIDIGDTLIDMRMKDVAVPVRIKAKEIGSTRVVCARTRPKFIDGIRAHYDEESI